MPIRLAPAAVLFTALGAGLALAIFMLVLATNRPWLGLGLVADPEADGLRIVSADATGPARDIPPRGTLASLTGADGSAIALLGSDLVEEPDVFETYAEMGAFFARQGVVEAILRSGHVELEIRADDGTVARMAVEPQRQRPIAALPAAFWLQIFVGLASFLIAAWVWSLRKSELATRIFALVGASILTFSFPAAVYSTRELAIDGGLFGVLSAINHLGALTFGAAMIALFLIYPRPLITPRRLLILPALFGAWWLADTLKLFSGPATGHHLPTLIEMTGILIAAGLQYWKTRGDPLARAALRWLGLSVAVGAGTFVATVIAPNLIGAPPMLSQGLAFVFFLLIYVGVALGVARYRLFELDEWAFRILFYVGGVMLLIAIDALLIFALPLDRIPAFGLALLLVAFVYLPFRDALARFFLNRRAPDHEHLFRRVMDVALAPPGRDRGARWQSLLQKGFKPLHVDSAVAATEVTIVEDGIALLIPGTGDLPALRLSYAHGGRKLFSLRDAAMARELHALLAYAMESRDAYEKGVAEERMRIARDMHDNIGVQLLGALHSRESARKDAMIRDTLSDLRDIINNASRPELSFNETLADLRMQVSEHLSAAGVTLEWQAEGDDMPTLHLHTIHTLRSLIREAVQNVIRHAQASTLKVAIRHHDSILAVTIEDDGKGFDAETADAGNGLANMRSRIAGLQGQFEVVSRLPGTRIAARFPLVSPGIPA